MKELSENKTIKNFTAADIEKYWNNKLSSTEMRELEKAAMEDPFLADAIEGYQNSENPEQELASLKDRFGKKLNEEAPVIPLLRKKYYWFRVAAAIIILVGSGLLIQQLFYKNKNESAVVKVTVKEEAKQNESVSKSLNPIDTLKRESTTSQSTTIVSGNKNNTTTLKNSLAITTTIDSLKFKDQLVSDTLNNFVAQNATKESLELKKESEKKEIADDKKASVLNEVVIAPAANSRSADADKLAKAKTFAQNNNQNGATISNRFNYRVVDAQKNPVPFANVMNTRDNVGTYTDIKGYFNLVSSDSIMDVQIKSLGFNSENYRLIASKQPNDLVLKEDRSIGFMDVSQGRQRVMNNVVRKDSAEIIEPVVGWGNYNTYVENNIKISEKTRSKNNTNQVELSFDVDKAGTPVNIAVTKSSQCKECDEEAIRLLKEGPKWKKKGKKSKITTITISVDQK